MPRWLIYVNEVILHVARDYQIAAINKLEQAGPCEFQQERPAIFEPLTVMLTNSQREIPPSWFEFSELAIPDRSDLARRYNLAETLRQFKHRKVVTMDDLKEEATSCANLSSV